MDKTRIFRTRRKGKKTNVRLLRIQAQMEGWVPTCRVRQWFSAKCPTGTINEH